MANGMTIGMTGGVMPVASVETATITDNRIGSVNTSPNIGVQGISRSVLEMVDSPNYLFAKMSKLNVSKSEYFNVTDVTQNNLIMSLSDSVLNNEPTDLNTLIPVNVVQLNETNTSNLNRLNTIQPEINRGRYSYPTTTNIQIQVSINSQNIITVNRYSYPRVR
jgi:hypothetical protein